MMRLDSVAANVTFFRWCDAHRVRVAIPGPCPSHLLPKTHRFLAWASLTKLGQGHLVYDRRRLGENSAHTRVAAIRVLPAIANAVEFRRTSRSLKGSSALRRMCAIRVLDGIGHMNQLCVRRCDLSGLNHFVDERDQFTPVFSAMITGSS